MRPSRRAGRDLREGFTTGTAAAAAAKAATLTLLGLRVPAVLDTPLPGGARLDVPIEDAKPEETPLGPAARGRVVKDGGDDPDATHMALIEALVRLSPAPGVRVDGGRGVGRVTLPGLPVAVGQAAINPAPRAQIAAAVQEALDAAGYSDGAEALIEVPDGETIARHTLNARLGILGGISILGTRGTVRPFSHEDWAASVAAGMDVARATGQREIGLCTGGRSERLLRRELPHLPEQCFVQAADLFAASCRAAAERGFSRLTWGLFIGKLVKQAMGLANTHARSTATDFAFLAREALAAGVSPGVANALREANTAMHALSLLAEDPARPALLRALCRRASENARNFAQCELDTRAILFDFDGTVLADSREDVQ
ncbi:cobalt-precorrin-6A synthase (deacetylating) [Alkalidesulfovibrio alkalitolerans DSM 16529]|jgi:cobalt-precorrin-5B (C1)-methyltransferase|uniref:Cobalt-precorrin-5B C(1)-methyltransferase n=1 Tax=Alkalidesulfovibrio alkalitolerans DSM 16529 TaxID=1121439 RepID=S7T382_9BACT|nr:cobalt-precorrin-5B (C(1))-methyltransferase [Alkalidesulfovibrio alkalitolerans]EPR30960.1 cobalt-precorrin-6A synthase (deacetylating) [Alkalidesulfovibrio alkalitolerans DSM 16529]